MTGEIVKLVEIPGQDEEKGVFFDERGGAARLDLEKMMCSGHCVVIQVDVSENDDRCGFNDNFQMFVVVGEGTRGSSKFQLVDGDETRVDRPEQGLGGARIL